jgi:hypothetical protein
MIFHDDYILGRSLDKELNGRFDVAKGKEEE